MTELDIREGWSYDDYVRAWREVESRANWVRGDLALSVETTYGERTLARYAGDVGEEYNTLRQYRQVAAAYGNDDRSSNSWSVHLVLAGQPDRRELVAGRSNWTKAEAQALVKTRSNPTITLYTHKGEPVAFPEPKSQATFNETKGDGISWAAWSWNPVTGCLHGCDYCYARAITNRFREQFPAGPDGFTPLFHSERLAAPKNTSIPEMHRSDPAYKRVFVCSMADLYGQWVPEDWISQVHEAMLASPKWQYILLTKFPSRYTRLDMPPGAWVGTSVDEQKRVRIAEDAFRKIEGDGIRKWLSLEPLIGPLKFSDLSMFDWVVIGSQTETHQPKGVVPAKPAEWDWVVDLYNQARAAGCKVHLKPNLANGRPGMVLPDEYPDA